MSSDRRRARERAAKKIQGDRQDASRVEKKTPSDRQDASRVETPQPVADIERPMSARMLRFVDEYPVDLNATQAAIRAGFSEKTAHVQGSRVLKDVRVAKAIAAALEARSARVGFTADDVLRKLAEIANEERDDALAKDRIRCLELLGKNLGMFNKLVLSGDPDSPIVTQVTRRIVRAAPD